MVHELLGSWPLAAVVITIFAIVFFSRSITALLGRIRRVGYGDRAIELAEDQSKAAEQQKQLERPVGDVDMVPATHAMPAPDETYAPIEQEIRNNIARLQPTPELLHAWLIRDIAQLRMAHAHERAYRLLLGSQIRLLQQVNVGAVSDMNGARALYDAASAAAPDFYSHFAFDTWINYPISVGAIDSRRVRRGAREAQHNADRSRLAALPSQQWDPREIYLSGSRRPRLCEGLAQQEGAPFTLAPRWP